MPVREFRDSEGKHWRVWNITPDSIHPQTRAEDYLADCFELGWLVFETIDGAEKRRLCPYPSKWEERPDPELGALLATADVVPAKKLAKERSFASQTPPPQADLPIRTADLPRASPSPVDERTPEHPDVTDLRVVRSFRYPGGRIWSVCVVPRTEDGGGPVLRFSAGARRVDLRDWPLDWPDYTEERLVELLRTVRRPVGSYSETDVEADRRHSDAGS